jgi:hypothetical protein
MISFEEGITFAQKIGATYVENSAVRNDNFKLVIFKKIRSH